MYNRSLLVLAQGVGSGSMRGSERAVGVQSRPLSPSSLLSKVVLLLIVEIFLAGVSGLSLSFVSLLLFFRVLFPSFFRSSYLL